MKKIVTTLTLAALCFTASAGEPNLTYIQKKLGDIEITSVTPSPIAGLYEVQFEGGLVYLTEDGEKLFAGELHNVKEDFSYTARILNKQAQTALAKVSDSDKIIYKAPNEKYKVSVFTDINCGYCAKLHAQMQQYNDKGITVEYLAFPRGGLNSRTSKIMQKIWCSSDKTASLTKAKLKRQYPKEKCSGQQVQQQFALGNNLGVNGTPAIFLSDGEMLGGYVEPAALLETLKEHFN